MLVVLLQANQQLYALPAGEVVEVVPLVELHPIRRAPPWLVGFANLRGVVAPVLDLPSLLGERPAPRVLGTRIALLRVQAGPHPLLGLLAERMIGTARLSPHSAFRTLSLPEAPYLGEVLLDDGRLVQMLRPRHLLSPDVQQTLFLQPSGEAGS
jgi:chemotaxis-related protein WspB